MYSTPTSSDGLNTVTEVTPGQADGPQSPSTGVIAEDNCFDGGSRATSPCLSSSPSALPPSSRPRRICSTPGCRRAMGSASNDPHTVCIVCRKGFCTVDKRCPECAEWSSAIVAGAYKHQVALQRKRDYIAKRKVSKSTVLPPSCSPGASLVSGGHSDIRDSVGPEDSVSQATFPREVNQFFHDFASFFGFSQGMQHSSFSEMVSDLVTQQVELQLAAKQSSLSALPLSSAKSLVQSSSNPLPDLSDRQGVQSPQADVSVGGSRGQAGTTHSLGLVSNVTTFDPPAAGKRPRQPKDVAGRVKRSRSVVGGHLAPFLPGCPSGRDQDGDGRDVLPSPTSTGPG